jgi:TPR repeat protein
MYKNGEGVPKDFIKAAEWYKKAADQGHTVAQMNLGNCYKFGEGVPKDLAKSVEYYRKSAIQGRAGAQYLTYNSFICLLL